MISKLFVYYWLHYGRRHHFYHHRFTHFPALAISAHNSDTPKRLIYGPKPTTLSSISMRRHCSWTSERPLWPQLPTVVDFLVVVAAAMLQRLHSRSLWSSLSSRVVKFSAVQLTMNYWAYPNQYLNWAQPRLNLQVLERL